ncbi:MAG: N4-(beta-N-acetylglucosaminyl)-L-asparaginase [Planctomycetota bacterium]|jgi:N4-(beta-N-acetylglucosaminyl)-L-asparaginase
MDVSIRLCGANRRITILMMSLNLSRVVLFASFLLLGACAGTPASVLDGPLVVSTWPFGRHANDEAMAALAAGKSLIDAVELGIRETERRSSDGSVGLGGRPNAAGYPQLDACIMDGPSRDAGAVGGIEGIVHPISAARHVMEKSKHVFLVGEGARWFALEHGVESIPIEDLKAMKAAWVDGHRPKDVDRKGHDTIALLIRDKNGHIAGGCSTSGAGGKLPGRVGDSPILGSGLYVDEEVGAAGATGIGENIMRYCGSFLVVEFMRQGMHPQMACEETVHRIASLDPRGYNLDVCFVALDKMGRYGAAASNQRFPFAVASNGRSVVVNVEQVTPR